MDSDILETGPSTTNCSATSQHPRKPKQVFIEFGSRGTPRRTRSASRESSVPDGSFVRDPEAAEVLFIVDDNPTSSAVMEVTEVNEDGEPLKLSSADARAVELMRADTEDVLHLVASPKASDESFSPLSRQRSASPACMLANNDFVFGNITQFRQIVK